jgi:hypothetical protein
MIFEPYRELVQPKGAKAWFAIGPTNEGARMQDGMQLICWTRALAWLTLSIMKMKKDRLDNYFRPADFSKCGER